MGLTTLWFPSSDASEAWAVRDPPGGGYRPLRALLRLVPPAVSYRNLSCAAVFSLSLSLWIEVIIPLLQTQWHYEKYNLCD